MPVYQFINDEKNLKTYNWESLEIEAKMILKRMLQNDSGNAELSIYGAKCLIKYFHMLVNDMILGKKFEIKHFLYASVILRNLPDKMPLSAIKSIKNVLRDEKIAVFSSYGNLRKLLYMPSGIKLLLDYLAYIRNTKDLVLYQKIVMELRLLLKGLYENTEMQNLVNNNINLMLQLLLSSELFELCNGQDQQLLINTTIKLIAQCNNDAQVRQAIAQLQKFVLLQPNSITQLMHSALYVNKNTQNFNIILAILQNKHIGPEAKEVISLIKAFAKLNDGFTEKFSKALALDLRLNKNSYSKVILEQIYDHKLGLQDFDWLKLQIQRLPQSTHMVQILQNPSCLTIMYGNERLNKIKRALACTNFDHLNQGPVAAAQMAELQSITYILCELFELHEVKTQKTIQLNNEYKLQVYINNALDRLLGYNSNIKLKFETHVRGRYISLADINLSLIARNKFEIYDPTANCGAITFCKEQSTAICKLLSSQFIKRIASADSSVGMDFALLVTAYSVIKIIPNLDNHSELFFSKQLEAGRHSSTPGPTDLHAEQELRPSVSTSNLYSFFF